MPKRGVGVHAEKGHSLLVFSVLGGVDGTLFIVFRKVLSLAVGSRMISAMPVLINQSMIPCWSSSIMETRRSRRNFLSWILAWLGIFLAPLPRQASAESGGTGIAAVKAWRTERGLWQFVQLCCILWRDDQFLVWCGRRSN